MEKGTKIIIAGLGLLGVVTLGGLNTYSGVKNGRKEGMKSVSSISAPIQIDSNTFRNIQYADGTKIPMVQLPDGSYTNLSGFYNSQEKDITRKLTGN